MNITFFDYPHWSKGKIINELISKFPSGWAGDILNWSIPHDQAEFENRVNNIFFTSIGGLVQLHNYGVPLDRINVFCHDEDDFTEFKRHTVNINYYLSNIRGFAVSSNSLINTILSHGVDRIPQKLNYGMDISGWEFNPRLSINNIGISGVLKRHTDSYFKDSKRSYLIKQLAEETGLTLLETNGKLHTYDDVKEWYKNVDMIVIAGVFEGGPLSPYEAALSGIPVMGCHCGSWVNMAYAGGGIVLPTNNIDFIKVGRSIINNIRNGSRDIIQMTHIAKHYVIANHSWESVLDSWLSFIKEPTNDKF
jgi:hypothetical protein